MTGAIAAALSILIILGCMSFSIERGERVKVIHLGTGSEVYEQSGSVTIPKGVTEIVYFPVPYATPPNLNLKNEFGGHCELVQEFPDRFSVRNNGLFDHQVTWTAKGLTIPLRTSIAPVVATVPAQIVVPTVHKEVATSQTSPTGPALPPVPVPIESQPKP